MTKFNVPDMSCGHCKASITKALEGAGDGVEISFDMENRQVAVSGLSTDRVIELLNEIGFPTTPT
ncbi:heavy-metal-associated domain-containing protein [Aliiroseovarius crassostreae]|uniref:heavy-metal-associated domain-containing protein n=1 Tax=Aliiroseovarius crassostreae TaxID=154981 RepID=UPI0021FA832E|nr:heavy-metal-associated domain-containing protein [Aliiroseovarius crassostreae]UWQ02171.1 heavy-metal-associated domain-containing protein [Aliiroseovarius crassostreae]